MKHYSLCPICGENALHEVKQHIRRESDGFAKYVPYNASVCDSCACETLTEKQALFNKRAMANFYREADGLLTGDQIKNIRLSLNLRQSDAAKLFGGGVNAFAKYESGDVTQSVSMDKLLRTANAVPQALEYLIEGCPDPRIKTLNVVQPIFRSTDITSFETVVQVVTSNRNYKSPIGAFKIFKGEDEKIDNVWDDSIATCLV